MTPRGLVLQILGALLGLLGLVVSGRVFFLAWESSWRRGIDFHVYLAAARIAADRGWPHVYDGELQRALIEPLFPRDVPWTPFASPPAVAWLTAPLSNLPLSEATVLWTVVLAIALGAAAAMAAGRRSVGWGLLSMAALPASGWDLSVGNVSGLLPLALAAAGVLLAAERDIAAGLVLVTLTFKPQLAWLAPVALLAAGRWRAVAAFAVGSAVLAIASVAVVQPSGLLSYLKILSGLSHLKDQRRFSLDYQISVPAVTAAIRVATVAGALAAGWRAGPRRAQLALAAGVAASLSVTPYLNVPDPVVCVPVAWWLWRAAPAGGWRWCAPIYWSAALACSFWELPWVIAQLGVVVAVLLARRPAAGADERRWDTAVSVASSS